MGSIIALNLVVIVLVMIVFACIGHKAGGGAGAAAGAWFSFVLSVALSGAGWLIYVIAHFVTKFW